MLNFSLFFLLAASLAAVFGFGGMAGAATGAAQLMFYVALVLFVASFVLGRRQLA
jgi:uncharacterized membrane protein YtjA (UPF0391 family)